MCGSSLFLELWSEGLRLKLHTDALSTQVPFCTCTFMTCALALAAGIPRAVNENSGMCPASFGRIVTGTLPVLYQFLRARWAPGNGSV